MANLPEKDQQIVDAHMGLIHRVVIACNNPGNVPDLEELLQQAENNDWKQLVATIRKIIAGNRSEALLQGLDDEDQGNEGPLNAAPEWQLVQPTSANNFMPRCCCEVSAFLSPLTNLSKALFGVIRVRS